MRLLLRVALVACALSVAYGFGAPGAKAGGPCVALNFGDPPSTGSITSSGDVDCFAFTGVVGDRVRVRVAKTSGTLGPLVTVRRPNATVACGPAKATTVELNCTVNAAGVWAISVEDAAGTHTGNYAIAINTLNSPHGCTALTNAAAPTTASIGSAAEMDCYTFSGARRA